MEDIREILLGSGFEAYIMNNGDKLDSLGMLSQLNIFVGANNSGKSKLMRLLSSQAKYSVKTLHLQDSGLRALKTFCELTKAIFETKNIAETNVITKRILEKMSNADAFYPIGNDQYEDVKNALSVLRSGSGNIGQLTMADPSRYYASYPTTIAQQVTASIPDESALQDLPNYANTPMPRKVYIPILRGLRLLDENHTDFYKDRTEKDYFSSSSDKPEIFTGLSLYNDLTDLLLGNQDERDIVRQYERFLSTEIFGGESVVLVPHKKDRVVVVKIGDEVERPIHDLGDGIQSIIIITYKVATQSDPTFFFIEEGETHLHPGLQRKLLEFLLKHEQHTFFMTTHSNHLLDMTLDYKKVSIFNFVKRLSSDYQNNKEARFVVEQLDSPSTSSLELLGVRDSSVFLVNATVWVEGITDRIYLRKMLSLYQGFLSASNPAAKAFEEDVHYSFVEYGGSAITHWSFEDDVDADKTSKISVGRLCGRAFVILDKDGDKKQGRKDELKKVLGDRLLVLPCREVENLLPPEVIRQVVISYECDDAHVGSFSYSSYQDKYLGRFIEDTVLSGQKKRQGSYAAPSGTISSKVEFCERALKLLDWDSLPRTTKEVVTKIYGHIKELN